MFLDQHFHSCCVFLYSSVHSMIILCLAVDREFPYGYRLLLDACRHEHMGLFAQSPGCHSDNSSQNKEIDQYRAAFCIICHRMWQMFSSGSTAKSAMAHFLWDICRNKSCFIWHCAWSVTCFMSKITVYSSDRGKSLTVILKTEKQKQI